MPLFALATAEEPGPRVRSYLGSSGRLTPDPDAAAKHSTAAAAAVRLASLPASFRRLLGVVRLSDADQWEGVARG